MLDRIMAHIKGKGVMRVLTKVIVFVVLILLASNCFAQQRPYGRDGRWSRIDVRWGRNHQPTSSTWSPTDYANIEIWIKADLGFAANLWTDQSGNGNDFSQSTGANQPSLATSVQNGLPGVLFDGTDFMSAGDVDGYSNTRGLTVYVVKKTAGAVADDIFISKYNATGGAREWYIKTDRYTTQEAAGAFDPNTAVTLTPSIGTKILTGTWLPGGKPTAYENGALVGSSTLAVTDITDTAADLDLGAIDSGNLWMLTGHILELIIYSDDHDATERAQVLLYLNNKWAVY